VITEVREARLLVTSDTHLGGLMSKAGRDLARFLDFAAERGYSVCINGDGLELMHTSLSSMTRESFEFFRHVKRSVVGSMRIYYTVGNHDIVLERFFNHWGVVNLVPFLNVQSGDRRIHIQHGHLYDPAFMRSPALYNWLTRASGTVLRFHAGTFRLYEKWHGLLGRKAPPEQWALNAGGSDRPFVDAAREISTRGFDAVIFGHTHAPGEMELGPGINYYNTGSWFGEPRYVRIEDGETTLERWPVGLP
jgi:UDP-2,3-diacylglucosamine pyrophosphatase LpxH